MRQFVFLILLGLFSCDKEEMDPLKAKLINTTWTVEKLELIDLNDIVTRTELHDPDNLNIDQKLSFRTDQYMSLYTGGTSGCGQWTVDKGKIRFVIGYGLIVPGYCSQANFSIIFLANNNIEIIDNDVLIIDGLAGAFNQFYYLPDWGEIVDQVTQGQIKAKVYFKKTDSGTQPELYCCGKFDWI